MIVGALQKFEGANGFEGLTSQMKSSYFWKKIKESYNEFDHFVEIDLAKKYNVKALIYPNFIKEKSEGVLGDS